MDINIIDENKINDTFSSASLFNNVIIMRRLLINRPLPSRELIEDVLYCAYESESNETIDLLKERSQEDPDLKWLAELISTINPSQFEVKSSNIKRKNYNILLQSNCKNSKENI